MTGIERLRELADKYAELGKDHTTIDVVPSGMAMLFSSIANQIEREHAEDCYGMVIDHGTVSRVASEMERHVLGHEDMEDSPVARWARELREALGGEEHGSTEGVSMSAYDLLPEDEREAIAWVREHGGLERVKWLLDWCLSHDSKIEQLDFDFWLSGRVMRELGFDGDMADRDEVERRLAARLMPEGYEWPRYESGELVSIGDEYECWCGNTHVVGSVTIMDGRSVLNGSQPHAFVVSDGSFTTHGKRVKRPEPKVLDADGVEVEVGDDLYTVGGMLKFHVSAIDKKSGRIATEAMFALDKWADPKMLTHRAPVLAADGRPLREGETVWGTGREEHEYVVLGQQGLGGGAGRFKVACHDVTDDVDCDCDPDLLTHERPDTREVKEEAWWRCEECGKQCRRPGEPFDTHRRTLTVSHVNHDPADCRRENLRALCAPCHLRYDAAHHAETRRKRRLAERGE